MMKWGKELGVANSVHLDSYLSCCYLALVPFHEHTWTTDFEPLVVCGPATYLSIAQALDHVLQYSSYLLLPASMKRFDRPA
jgi:hypothetical protein